MQTTEKRGTLRVVNGWIICECGKKLQRISPDTEAENLDLWCRYCKRPHKVNIHRGECFESHGP